MRQRKVKNLDEKLAAVSAFQVTDPSPEVWTRVFGQGEGGNCGPDGSGRTEGRDLFLEIGCGKGDFLLQQALLHPENDYIGIEGQASVVLRAMEKADLTEKEKHISLNNLRFACAFVNGMEELFSPGSLAGVYLNFSDPWPKGRHVKRRLTYRGRLEDYARALRPGGFIAFKTDNDALFDFTLEEIAALGWTPAEECRDLHASSLKARLVTTEYERKFRDAGKAIHYVKVIVSSSESIG